MCMRASGASELRQFWLFYILKLLFLSIFCRYIRYFVGTNDMLVGLYMYRQIFKCTDKTPKKHYWGGGQLPPCPPPPPLATLMQWLTALLHRGTSDAACALSALRTLKHALKPVHMYKVIVDPRMTCIRMPGLD